MIRPQTISSGPEVNSTRTLSNFWLPMAGLRESLGGQCLWGGVDPREVIWRQDCRSNVRASESLGQNHTRIPLDPDLVFPGGWIPNIMEREGCNYHPLEETHILLLRSSTAVIEPVHTRLMQGLKVLRVHGGGAASRVRSSRTRQWGLEVSRKRNVSHASFMASPVHRTRIKERVEGCRPRGGDTVVVRGSWRGHNAETSLLNAVLPL